MYVWLHCIISTEGVAVFGLCIILRNCMYDVHVPEIVEQEKKERKKKKNINSSNI